MREFDKETVRKIWQRVQAEHPASQSIAENRSLSEWIAWEKSFADLYRRLSGRMSGQRRNYLLQLARQEQQHAELLRGICIMTEGDCSQIHPIPIPKAPMSVLFRQCYGEKLRMLAEYEKRASDSQFREVFQSLARQEQEQCRFLLRLIGTAA